MKLQWNDINFYYYVWSFGSIFACQHRVCLPMCVYWRAQTSNRHSTTHLQRFNRYRRAMRPQSRERDTAWAEKQQYFVYALSATIGPSRIIYLIVESFVCVCQRISCHHHSHPRPPPIAPCPIIIFPCAWAHWTCSTEDWVVVVIVIYSDSMHNNFVRRRRRFLLFLLQQQWRRGSYTVSYYPYGTRIYQWHASIYSVWILLSGLCCPLGWKSVCLCGVAWCSSI